MTTVGNDGHDDSSLKHNEHQSYGLSHCEKHIIGKTY
jgi:hypothetical protein